MNDTDWEARGYRDLARWFETVDTYTDFEGFADPARTEAVINHEDVQNALANIVHHDADKVDEKRALLTDLLYHYVFENIDQAGYEPTPHECIMTIYTLDWLISGRYWMRHDYEGGEGDVGSH